VPTRPVVGFIPTWPVYQGTTIDRHADALLRGIRAAAADEGCDLLLGAGVGLPSADGRWRSVWPVPTPEADLVPIGPWNTHGLIVVPDDLMPAQSRYLQDVAQGGLPVVSTTPEAPWPRVVVDNEGGIRQAVRHLVGHGHREIAYVAGKRHRGGDSAERERAFREALADAGLVLDHALVAHGEHRREEGRVAMERILATGRPFTALVASNDLSCLGALDALEAAGRRVPEDVAAIGFDDILDARSHTPPLTTVRHPTFALGDRALREVLRRIRGREAAMSRHAAPEGGAVVAVGEGESVEPTRLIIRRSCGCLPSVPALPPVHTDDPAVLVTELARAMARAALDEARTSTLEQLETGSRVLLDAVLDGVLRDGAALRTGIARTLAVSEARDEDAHVWQGALSALSRNATELRCLIPDADLDDVLRTLDQARLLVSEHAQRRSYRILLDHKESMSRVGQLTSRLLATQRVEDMADILHEHLPGLGVSAFLACRYEPEEDDPAAWSRVVLAHGLVDLAPGSRIPTRAFPPPSPDREDGSRQWLVLPLRPDGDAGGFVAMVTSDPEPAAAIVSNVASALRTARLYQEAIEGRRQAEEASKLRSRFLSTVSHELRTPLGVVVGLADMILQEAAEGSGAPDAIVRDVQRMAASAGHLGRLIDDVLDLASGQAGQLRLALAPVDLSVVLAQAVEAARELVNARGLAFEVDIPASGPVLLADATRIRQVVLDLVDNAVRSTERGSIRLDATVVDGRVTVAVSDTGEGVPAADQERIFTEFDRGSRAGSGSRRGLGLGLAICRHLVELHGGSIGVSSPGEDGWSSRFWFTLPVAADVAGVVATAATSPVTHPPGGRHHASGRGSDVRPLVLVVEDDPDTAELHARIVAEAGGRAVRALDGDTALDALARDPPDLVLLDLGMRGRDGFAVLEAMRERTATRHVPVIVVTGRPVADADIERLRPGVAGILRKGTFTSAETADRIRSAVGNAHRLAGPTQQLVRRAVAFIEAHHAEPLGRDDIARHVAISSDYLTDCFRQELGITPMTYLGRCRIRHARELLEATDRTVTSVALAVGFSDVSHFSRTFHHEVGVSPRAYRRGDRLVSKDEPYHRGGALS
jgi:signal transduction histidine kinase/DNA-binding LacI/PurR family transcriptional regulator/AraC-like DNA-binding protein